MSATIPTLVTPSGEAIRAVPVIGVDQTGNFSGGGGGGGGGGSVSISDGSDVAQGTTTDGLYTDKTGAAKGTVIGLLKTLYANLPGVGQKTMAASQPVVIASDQSKLGITIANGDNAAQGSTTDAAYSDTTGAANGTTVGTLKGLFVLFASRLPSAGQKTMANSQPVVIASDQAAVATKVADGSNGTQGTTTDAAYADATGAAAGSMVALLKGAYKLLAGTLSVRQASLTATTDRSGSATTTSGALSVAANPARNFLVGQNIGSASLGFNEQGGTAAIGSAGTYTVAAGQSFSVSTNKLINFVAASGTVAVTMTEG